MDMEEKEEEKEEEEEEEVEESGQGLISSSKLQFCFRILRGKKKVGASDLS